MHCIDEDRLMSLSDRERQADNRHNYPVAAPQIISQSQNSGLNDQNSGIQSRSAINRSSHSQKRDLSNLSREEKQIIAAEEYQENMARFNKTMGQRKESLERFAKEEQEAGAFQDDEYLALINQQQCDDQED